MVIRVGPHYSFKYPASRDILAIKSETVTDIQKHRVVDFFDSYANNRAINEDKAGYLISAQEAFAVAALLLFLITVVIAGYMSWLALGPWFRDALGCMLESVSESIVVT